MKLATRLGDTIATDIKKGGDAIFSSEASQDGSAIVNIYNFMNCAALDGEFMQLEDLHSLFFLTPPPRFFFFSQSLEKLASVIISRHFQKELTMIQSPNLSTRSSKLGRDLST